MLIQKGTIVTSKEKRQADLRIEGEIITEIGENLQLKDGEEVIDASGKLVLPGGIDAHTHFDMPAGDDLMTSDTFTSGSKAAIAGGTTSILDFAEPDLGAPLADGLAVWQEKSVGKTYCDFGYHMTVSHWDETMDAQIADMVKQGVSSFKAYTAYKDGIGVEDDDLYRILKGIRKAGGLLLVHAENGDMINALMNELAKEDPALIMNHPKSRPNLVEKEAVSRVIDIAQIAKAPVYIVHVSTAEALDVITQAKKKGAEVYCETCPHYLLLNVSKYEPSGLDAAKYVMSPPLRFEEDETRLRKGLYQKEIDCLSTDHCSFTTKQKAAGEKDFRKIPNGIPGVETRMELMYSFGKEWGLDECDVAALTSENPAKIFGLYPKKGILAVGSDADLVIMNPNTPHTISKETQYQDVDYAPFEGVQVDHKIEQVFLRGKHLVKDGKITAQKPEGEFLFCEPLHGNADKR